MRLLLGKIKNIKANQIDLLKCPKKTFFLLNLKINYLAFLVFFSVLLGFLLKMKTVNYFQKVKIYKRDNTFKLMN